MKVKVTPFDRCERCELYQYRDQVVHGVGPMNAKIVIVGQNPGAEEDREGVPFIGKAGKILNKCIERAGLKRSRIRITNAVHCLTPSNRPPSPTEIGKCFKWLKKELIEIEPEVIVLAGGVAMFALDIRGSVMEECGKIHEGEYEWGECAIIPMIHPAAIMYASSDEKKNMRRKIVGVLRDAKKCLE